MIQELKQKASATREGVEKKSSMQSGASGHGAVEPTQKQSKDECGI
jgi:hypothetical protein